MKRHACLFTTVLLLVSGMALHGWGQGWATDPDVAWLEARVYTEDGSLGAVGGPWDWSEGSWMVGFVPVGSNLTLDILALNQDGVALYRGVLGGLELTPQFGMGGDTTVLILYRDTEGIAAISADGDILGVALLEPFTAVIEVAVDIKPGSLRNPFNVKSRGSLPVAVLGSEDLDVTTLDPETVTLAGVPARAYAYADVSGDFVSVEGGPDGYMDLVLHVPRALIAAALGAVGHGDIVELVLSATSTDDVPVLGADSVRIINKGRARGHGRAVRRRRRPR
jgi:hypothetical protein